MRRRLGIWGASDEALRLMRLLAANGDVEVVRVFDVDAAGGIGHGVSEAPRGLLYHRYEVDADGLIADAHIVPPTSQNQLSIEDDLRAFVPSHAHLPDDDLQWQLEQAIRNYDPCISCATHFLDLTVHREDP